MSRSILLVLAVVGLVFSVVIKAAPSLSESKPTDREGCTIQHANNTQVSIPLKLEGKTVYLMPFKTHSHQAFPCTSEGINDSFDTGFIPATTLEERISDKPKWNRLNTCEPIFMPRHIASLNDGGVLVVDWQYDQENIARRDISCIVTMLY